MVTSPLLGSRLSNGVYCLIARCSTSSWKLDVALAYSLICWHSKVCSSTVNREVDMLYEPSGLRDVLSQQMPFSLSSKYDDGYKHQAEE